MITLNSPNYNIYSNLVSRPNFKGCTETTTMPKAGQNIDNMCVHETYFFRNIESLNFVKDYVTKNFPKGTNIAEFASSTGEETYSLAMLLNDKNKDKKYKIHGYDIAPRIINQMDTHLYEVTSSNYEVFLDSDIHTKTDEQRELKELFNQHFEKFPKDLQVLSYSPRMIKKINKKIEKSQDPEEIRELNYMLSFSKIPLQNKWSNFFYPKTESFKDIINFETKDISELGHKYNLERNTGVIFFKNAFYHITGFNCFKDPSNADLHKASTVTKEVNRALDKNGIFVIGTLIRDHLYNNQPTRIIEQGGEEIEVCDTTIFHEMLKDNGFEPIYYEPIREFHNSRSKNTVYLPSIWKKVKEV